jgi:hypothetical protein
VRPDRPTISTDENHSGAVGFNDQRAFFQTAYGLGRLCQVQLKQKWKNHSPSATSQDCTPKPVENEAISVEKAGKISPKLD